MRRGFIRNCSLLQIGASMKRRKFVTIASSIGVTALAGCLNSGSGNEKSGGSLPDVEVEFEVSDRNLVAKHAGGDVLPRGQQVSLTVAGDQVSETTVSEDVRVGGEIIRAENVNTKDKYIGTKLVGLYTEQGGEDVELASAEVDIPHPAPNTTVGWDYNATEEELRVYGGFNPDNTEKLRFANDASGSMRFTDINGESLPYLDETAGPDGEAAVTGSIDSDDIIGTSSGGAFTTSDSVELVWVGMNDDMTATLGVFEGPDA